MRTPDRQSLDADSVAAFLALDLATAAGSSWTRGRRPGERARRGVRAQRAVGLALASPVFEPATNAANFGEGA
jgi:hypothetical protein